MSENTNEPVQTSSAPGQQPEKNQGNKKTLIIVVVVVLLGVFGLLTSSRFFSGEKVAERMIEKAYERASDGAMDVDIEYGSGGDGTIRMTGEDGVEVEYSAGGDVALPDAWPTDIPVMDDARVTYSGSVEQDTGNAGMTLVLTTDKNSTEVIEYYKQTLKDSGWTIVSTISMGDGGMLGVSKGEREASIYAAGSGSEGTSVTISIIEQ